MRVLLISIWIDMWVTRAYIGVNMRGIGFLSVSLQKVRMRPALPLSMSDMGGADGGFNDILEQQFLELSTGKGKKLNWSKFYDWEEVQALLAEEVCDRAVIENIWCKIAGSLETDIDYKQFSAISERLDAFFEVMEDGEEPEFDEAVVESVEALAGADVWSQSFTPSASIESEFLVYLTTFFTENTSGKGKSRLSYTSFAEWGDVQSMLEEGEVDESCLKELWAEAVIKQQSLAGEERELSKELTLDSFVRLNIRLDQTLDEIAEALDSLTDDDVINYLKDEFRNIAGSLEGLITKEQLQAWTEEELKGVATSGQILALWEALPKQGDAIDLASFLAFNEAVEDIEGMQ